MRGEMSTRSLEREVGCEEWLEGVWKDCPGLECEGFLIRFRVWTVFSKPERDKKGCEPCQCWSKGSMGGEEAHEEAGRVIRGRGKSQEGVMWQELKKEMGQEREA